MTHCTASTKTHSDRMPIERLADGSIRFLVGGRPEWQRVTLTRTELVIWRDSLNEVVETRIPVKSVTGFGFRRIVDDECWTGIAFESGGKTHRIGYNLERGPVDELVKAMGKVAPDLTLPYRTDWESIGCSARRIRRAGVLAAEFELDCAPPGAEIFGLPTAMVLLLAVWLLAAIPHSIWGLEINTDVVVDDSLNVFGLAKWGIILFVFGYLGTSHSKRLRIDPKRVDITRYWLGLPWGRTTIAVQDINRIELLPNADADGLVSAIALHCKGRRWRFGENLSLIEANGLVEEMKRIAPTLLHTVRVQCAVHSRDNFNGRHNR